MSVNLSFSIISFNYCSDFRAGHFIYMGFIMTKTFLLLPLLFLVLYLGHQRWRQQRSFATTSHSDIFTYHGAAMELISVLGNTVYFCGVYTGQSVVMKAGFYVGCIVFPGQMFLHILTCVERYLAVVHPVTYLGLRQSGGVKIRNISTVCVWLLCFVWSGVTAVDDLIALPFFCSVAVSLIIVSFCSLRVLCVLIRPGPGDVGSERERDGQSKQRAFYTIMAIMGVLWLWFAGFLVFLALSNSGLLSHSASCLLMMSSGWLSLPSSLVLPVLFLYRAGKLLCCH